MFVKLGWILALYLCVAGSRSHRHHRSHHRSHEQSSPQPETASGPKTAASSTAYQQLSTLFNKISPHFDTSTSTNITATAGKSVFLPCSVRHLGDRTVSWIRRPGLHVLTVGRYTYTMDQRFQAVHLDNSESWALQIKYPTIKDSGVYECQVSTLPKISRFVTLNVVVSKAKIMGAPHLYVNGGSTINISCEINGPPQGTDYVFWYHNGKVVNYDDAHRHEFDTNRAISRLIITSAHVNDSGNYSCVPSNTEADSISVFVLNNEVPAAMQDSLSSCTLRLDLGHRELLLWMILLPIYLLR